jgi:hypothetical protein
VEVSDTEIAIVVTSAESQVVGENAVARRSPRKSY